jgi:hypothetical protein
LTKESVVSRIGFLNILSILCVLIIYIYTRFLLSKSKEVQYKVIKIQLFFVLLYNIVIHIVVPTKIPIELSTISYFVVPVILYFNIKKLHVWAVYAAFTSGFFYYVSMIIAGDAMYGNFPIYSYSTSLFNHGTLIVYSIIVARDITFRNKEIHIIHIGLILTMVYALLMRPIITHPGRIFIYMILDADLVKDYFFDIKYIMYPIYYIWLGLYIYFSGYVVFLLNKILIPKEEAKEELQ